MRNEEVPLEVEFKWSAEDYEYCKEYMEKTRGLPFGSFEVDQVTVWSNFGLFIHTCD